MKKLSFIVMLFILFGAITACSNKSYRVDGASNVDESSAESYATYGFASQVDNKLDPGFFFLNDLMLKARIRDAVTHEMDSRGYAYTSDAPDLIVNFRVFDKETKVLGLQNMGDTYWGATENYQTTSNEAIDLQAGSIILHVVDRNSGKIIFQGYASGLMDGNVFNTEKNKIAESVSMIYDRYNLRADNL